MRKLFVFFLLSIVVMSIGCSQSQTTPTLTVEPVRTSTFEMPTNTSLPPKVVLYILENNRNTNSIQQVVIELAASTGWVYEEKNIYDSADLTNDVVMAVFIGSPDDLGMLSAKPEIRSIIITHAEISPASNVSILFVNPSDLAFVAGYIAELTAEDWRAGSLMGNDGAYSGSERAAFRNGGWYLCGLCNPKFPPYPGFPTVEQQSIQSDWTAWQSSADLLLANRIKVVYLSPESNSIEVSGYLARMEVNLLGQGIPPVGIEDKWITSLNWQISTALREEWDQLIIGNTGRLVRVPVMLEYTNEDLLSMGKQRLVNEVITLLENGMINTQTIP